MAGPLEGIRVFDLTMFMVGPWASMLLGSLGAEVFHIEQPGVDWSELSAGVPPTINGTSIGYIAWNMNKRCISLDLKDAEDQRFAHDLVATCDVFLCNMRTGVPERLGLGYEELRVRNPGLVYCRITGQGTTGPRASDRGTDNIMQALTGIWATQGARGEEGQMFRHYTAIDATAGNAAAQGILLALYARRRTGTGQLVEVTMIDASATLQVGRYAEHFAGMEHEPRGSSAFGTAPDRAFVCEDQRWIGVSVSSDAEWARFCQAVNREQWSSDDRFRSNAGRVENRKLLEEQLVDLLRTRPRAYWEHTLSRADVAWGIPMGWDELRYHEQVAANGFLREVETPAWGTVWTGGPPWKFSKTPASVWGPSIPGIDTYAVQDELTELQARRSDR